LRAAFTPTGGSTTDRFDLGERLPDEACLSGDGVAREGRHMKNAILLGLLGTALTLSISVSTAQAWGSCGRGPWRSFPTRNKDRTDSPGDVSVCSCTNGQSGAATGSEWRNGVVGGLGGPSNGGVGVELEAWYEGARISIPVMADATTPFVAATYFTNSGVQLYGPSWSDGHEFTGRYRSVCLTNLPSLLAEPHPSAWFY
jgi:hypothetical protein